MASIIITLFAVLFSWYTRDLKVHDSFVVVRSRIAKSLKLEALYI